MTGLSFLVKSADQKNVLHFSERTFSSQYAPQDILIELKTEIEREPILQDCTEITLVYSHSTYTLVPQVLFDETKLSEYLKFNSKILTGDFIAFDRVSDKDVNVVYVPFININNYFFETFGSFQYYHAATLLLEYVLHKEATNKAPTAYIHIGRAYVDLVAVENGKLLLCNAYPYKTPEDLAYYVLFAFEQLQWNPDSVATTVLGAVTENDSLFSILYTYIRNIAVGEILNLPEINGLAPHQQFLLKNT